MSDVPPVPEDALRYFRRKRLRVGFDYMAVWNEEHAIAFTVAKITSLDVLETIRQSIETAIADGQPFEQWRNELRPKLEKAGWWRPREVIDNETGEIGVSRLNHPQRLRTIYETNTRVAYAAGQWERVQRTKEVLPYLLRTVGPSLVHREQHLAWHGVLLPADDPWLEQHPCPCGWGCKCRYRQIGRVEYAKLVADGVPSPGRQQISQVTGLPTGRKVTQKLEPITTAPKVELRAWTNRRTGKTELIPKGVDPGFNYGPGAAARRARLDAVLKDKAGS